MRSMAANLQLYLVGTIIRSEKLCDYEEKTRMFISMKVVKKLLKIHEKEFFLYFKKYEDRECRRED